MSSKIMFKNHQIKKGNKIILWKFSWFTCMFQYFIVNFVRQHTQDSIHSFDILQEFLPRDGVVTVPKCDVTARRQNLRSGIGDFSRYVHLVPLAHCSGIFCLINLWTASLHLSLCLKRGSQQLHWFIITSSLFRVRIANQKILEEIGNRM